MLAYFHSMSTNQNQGSFLSRRITASHQPKHNGLGWKGLLEVIWSNPPAQAGTHGAGCPTPCPSGFWRSPVEETPQPLWATCASTPSPTQWRSASRCSEGASRVPVCAHWLLSWHWAPLNIAWLEGTICVDTSMGTTRINSQSVSPGVSYHKISLVMNTFLTYQLHCSNCLYTYTYHGANMRKFTP